MGSKFIAKLELFFQLLQILKSKNGRNNLPFFCTILFYLNLQFPAMWFEFDLHKTTLTTPHVCKWETVSYKWKEKFHVSFKWIFLETPHYYCIWTLLEFGYRMGQKARERFWWVSPGHACRCILREREVEVQSESAAVGEWTGIANLFHDNVPFVFPLKISSGFLMNSGGIEMKHWLEMGLNETNSLTSFKK